MGSLVFHAPVHFLGFENLLAVGKGNMHAFVIAEWYPFPDIWDPLARVFEAWGFDRCLWGTD